VRRSLTWTLVATVVLSAAVLWNSEVPRIVSAVEPRIREHVQELDLPVTAQQLGATVLPPLPSTLAALALEPAKRDLFAATVPIAAPASVPPVSAPVASLLTPPPQAPSIQLRFLGMMLNPDGQRLVYLARGDAAVLVGIGDRLDEGYVVESITADSVGLVYPQFNTRASIAIPPAPQQ